MCVCVQRPRADRLLCFSIENVSKRLDYHAIVYRGAVPACCRCCDPTGRWLAALRMVRLTALWVRGPESQPRTTFFFFFLLFFFSPLFLFFLSLLARADICAAELATWGVGPDVYEGQHFYSDKNIFLRVCNGIATYGLYLWHEKTWFLSTCLMDGMCIQ